MNYLLDGKYEISNNAERRVKSYVIGRKNSLFHGKKDGATASAVVLILIKTAKASNRTSSISVHPVAGYARIFRGAHRHKMDDVLE